eukprot:jgi/Galph1/3772/GphlegSOOS_G2403.1
MAYRKLETRVPFYLDEILGKVSSLPSDLKNSFSKIKELDAKCLALQTEADRLYEECLERGQSRSKSSESLKRLWKDLEETQREMTTLTDQKVKLAEKAYEAVDKNVRQLDEKLREFEAHLRAEGKWPVNAQERKLTIGSGTNLKSSRERGERKLSNLAVIEDMPVDPNEPRYCYCNQVSYGEMIACDNTNKVSGDALIVGVEVQIDHAKFIHVLHSYLCMMVGFWFNMPLLNTQLLPFYRSSSNYGSVENRDFGVSPCSPVGLEKLENSCPYTALRTPDLDNLRNEKFEGSRHRSPNRLRSVSRDRGADYEGDFRVIDWPNESSKIKIRSGYGVLLGLLAAYLDIAVEWLSDLKFGACTVAPYLNWATCCEDVSTLDSCSSFLRWSEIIFPNSWVRMWPSTSNFLFYCVISVLYTCIGSILVITLAPYAAGSGIPEVKAILNGVVMKGFLSPWTFIVKMIGVSLAVAAGLSAGKEGPYVHLGCCLCTILCSIFHLIRHDGRVYRELLSCASAAGVAVAFGAPVGGVLFSLEEVSTYTSSHVLWQAFYCAFVAAMTLKVINPYYNGKTVIFEIPSNLPWNWFEIIFFGFIGAVGGLLGAVFIKSNLKWMKKKESVGCFRRYPMLEILPVTLLTCSLFYFNDFLGGSNSEILTSLFNECSKEYQQLDDVAKKNEAFLCSSGRVNIVIGTLIMGTILKLFTAIITFGIKLPTGLFIPSLTIGGLYGRLIGILVKYMVSKYPSFPLFQECLLSSSCVSPAIYAVTGAAAMLGGVTRVSVSLVVIMMELTNGLHYMLPIMIAVLVSKWFGDVLHIDSIYELYIRMKRYPYLGNMDTHQLTNQMISTQFIMRKPVVFIPSSSFSLSELTHFLLEYRYRNFPIVASSDDNSILGSVSREALQFAIDCCYRDGISTSDPFVRFTPPSLLTNLHQPYSIVSSVSSNEGILVELGYIMDFFTLTLPQSTPMTEVRSVGKSSILYIDSKNFSRLSKPCKAQVFEYAG